MVDIRPCSYRESTDPFLKGTNKLVVCGIEGSRSSPFQREMERLQFTVGIFFKMINVQN